MIAGGYHCEINAKNKILQRQASETQTAHITQICLI